MSEINNCGCHPLSNVKPEYWIDSNSTDRHCKQSASAYTSQILNTIRILLLVHSATLSLDSTAGRLGSLGNQFQWLGLISANPLSNGYGNWSVCFWHKILNALLSLKANKHTSDTSTYNRYLAGYTICRLKHKASNFLRNYEMVSPF